MKNQIKIQNKEGKIVAHNLTCNENDVSLDGQGHSANTGGGQGHSANTGGGQGHSANTGGGQGHSANTGGGQGHSANGKNRFMSSLINEKSLNNVMSTIKETETPTISQLLEKKTII